MQRLPGWKDNRVFQRQVRAKHPGHGCQRFGERYAFSGDGSSRNLPATLMLIEQNLDQLRVRAPGLAQLREHIVLLKHTLMVVLPEVSKKPRRFQQRYGVDVSGAGLEAVCEIGIDVILCDMPKGRAPPVGNARNHSPSNLA